MLSRKLLATSPERATEAGAGATGALESVRSGLRTVVDWLRVGYPDEAPAQGHSPLMALNGPIALSPMQTAQVVDELGGRPSDPTDIDVAITKATGRLPRPSQAWKVSRALDR